MRVILTTVGTSLAGNAKKALGAAELTNAQADQYLHAAPFDKATAETNSLGRIMADDDRVELLHSHTDESRFCAEALARHYRKLGRSVELHDIPDLTYSEKRFKYRGLRSLTSVLIARIRAAQADRAEPVINATGGFKAESAMATMVGLLFQVPVYYIYESFSDVVEIPRLPIAWDYQVVADNENLFAWLAEDLRRSGDAEPRIRGASPELATLIAEEEGYTFLSASGEALYEAYRHSLVEAKAIPVLFSVPAAKFYSSAERQVQRELDGVLERLRVRGIRVPGTHQVGNCDVLVFPSGRYPQRLFYSEEPDGSLKVYEIRNTHEAYEKLIDRGVSRCNYTDFHPAPTG